MILLTDKHLYTEITHCNINISKTKQLVHVKRTDQITVYTTSRMQINPN